MKTLYWRPQKVSSITILMVGLFSLCLVALVEVFPSSKPTPHYEKKLAAARLAAQAMDAIKRERLRQGRRIDPLIDPAETGLLGWRQSCITSVSGHLESKQTATNPNFAAAVVEMLLEAGVREGDCVAVGYTGSIPGLNVALCAALETLHVRPIIIASALSSQYGANIPKLMWLDMERLLYDKGLISFRSAAVSVGGYEDRGESLSPQGRAEVLSAIERSGLPFIDADSYQASLETRMQIYRQQAGPTPIKAYINVGGGTVSVGRSLGKKLYLPGLNHYPPEGSENIDGVMNRFARQGLPVIHLVQAKQLARRYSLAVSPQSPSNIRVGAGKLFAYRRPNRILAAAMLVVILLSLRAIVLTDQSFRWRQWLARRLRGKSTEQSFPVVGDKSPELMV